MTYKVNFAAIKEDATGAWFEIFEELAPELNPAISKHPHHTRCPMHGGSDGFRFFEDAPNTGGAICNTCGAFSDGFKLLRWIKDWCVMKSFSQVGIYLGLVGSEYDSNGMLHSRSLSGLTV